MEKRLQVLLFFCGVFMSSVHTLKWTNVPVELGRDAILNCSLDEDNIIWNIMKLLGGGPVKILRTYNKRAEVAVYDNDTFRDRYSVKLGNRLFIHKVTEEDRLFYCTRADDTSIFNEIFRLVSATELPTNQTKDCLKDFTVWPLVSLAFNFILITALAGSWYSVRCHNGRCHPVSPGNGNPSPADAVYGNVPPDSTYQTLNPQTLDDNATYSTVTPTHT